MIPPGPAVLELIIGVWIGSPSVPLHSSNLAKGDENIRNVRVQWNNKRKAALLQLLITSCEYLHNGVLFGGIPSAF